MDEIKLLDVVGWSKIWIPKACAVATIVEEWKDGVLKLSLATTLERPMLSRPCVPSG